MIRIGVTQRVTVDDKHGERRDCLDQSWAAFLKQSQMLAIPLPNTGADAAVLVEELRLHGVVLTGGNDIATMDGAIDAAPERDRFEWRLIESCLQKDVPLLGICRGMQVVNLFFGGKLTKLTGHVATRHAVEAGGASRVVNSFHNYGVRQDDLAPELDCASRAADGSVEAVAHRKRAVRGLMWHPEREDPFDAQDRALFANMFGCR